MKKFKDPTKDDVNVLLCQCWLVPHPEIARMLLELGAEVNARIDGRMSIEAAIDALSFGLDSIFQYSSHSENRRTDALACIEVLAQAGARWNPADPRTISSFRRALGRAERSVAIRVLKRLVEARALGEGIFRELMRTPQMKALLDNGWVGDTAALKRYAGFEQPTKPRRGSSADRRGQPFGKW
jgi:hypothetical protein